LADYVEGVGEGVGAEENPGEGDEGEGEEPRCEANN